MTDRLDLVRLRVAELVRRASLDPNTQIGAVLVNEDGLVIAAECNAFPLGIANSDERWTTKAKYTYVVHAEHNAILSAARRGQRTQNGRLYLVGMGPPTVPCVSCAKAIIQAGIIEVIGAAYKPPTENWEVSLQQAADLLREADVAVREVPYEDLDVLQLATPQRAAKE